MVGNLGKVSVLMEMASLALDITAPVNMNTTIMDRFSHRLQCRRRACGAEPYTCMGKRVSSQFPDQEEVEELSFRTECDQCSAKAAVSM